MASFRQSKQLKLIFRPFLLYSDMKNSSTWTRTTQSCNTTTTIRTFSEAPLLLLEKAKCNWKSLQLDSGTRWLRLDITWRSPCSASSTKTSTASTSSSDGLRGYFTACLPPLTTMQILSRNCPTTILNLVRSRCYRRIYRTKSQFMTSLSASIPCSFHLSRNNS
jgi:hypothetical protein